MARRCRLGKPQQKESKHEEDKREQTGYDDGADVFC